MFGCYLIIHWVSSRRCCGVDHDRNLCLSLGVCLMVGVFVFRLVTYVVVSVDVFCLHYSAVALGLRLSRVLCPINCTALCLHVRWSMCGS